MSTTTVTSPPLVAPAPAPSRRRPRVDRARLRRWLVTSAVFIVLAGAVAALLVYRRHRAASKASQLETVTVDRGRIVARVTATGTLSAIVTVQVGAQVSGRIQKLYVDYNSPVKKGQVVAEIDPRMFRAAVEQAHANRDAVRGQLTAARATAENNDLILKRTTELRRQHLIAQQELDNAVSTAKASRAQVAALQGQVEQTDAAAHQAELNLEYTKIVSPTDGVVISRNVDVGQTVASAFQAPVLFTIAEDLRQMQVDTSVAEADVGKLHDGMTATFTVDAYGSEQFRGRVRQVRNAPQTVQNVVTYDAVVDVPNPDLRLKPGMTANVTFVYGEKSDVVRVSNSALRFRAPEAWWGTRRAKIEAADRRTVWAVRDGKPAAVSIRIGISDGAQTEVLEGELREGDVLVTDAGNTSSVPPAMRRVL